MLVLSPVQVKFQVGEDELLLNKLPDDPGHFVTLHLHHRPGFDFGSHCLSCKRTSDTNVETCELMCKGFHAETQRTTKSRLLMHKFFFIYKSVRMDESKSIPFIHLNRCRIAGVPDSSLAMPPNEYANEYKHVLLVGIQDSARTHNQII